MQLNLFFSSLKESFFKVSCVSENSFHQWQSWDPSQRPTVNFFPPFTRLSVPLKTLIVAIQHLAVFQNFSWIQECDGRSGIRLTRGAKLNQQVLLYWVQNSMCSEAPCSLMGWTLLWLPCRSTYVHLRAGSVTHLWCSSSWKKPEQ